MKLSKYLTVDHLRMAQWLALAACMYALAYHFRAGEGHLVGTGLWKAGHVVSGAYIGYWLDRNLFGRITCNTNSDMRAVARAIVVAASIVGLAFGL